MLSRLDDTRRRGMPEIAGFGKHFYFTRLGTKRVSPQKSNGRSHGRNDKAAETRRYLPNRSTSRACSSRPLVVGRIILSELGLWSGLPALHVASAVALWDEFAFALRIRRDDHSAAGGQTENQFSIRRNANHPCPRRSASAPRQLRVPLVKKRLPSPRPVRCQSSSIFFLSRRRRVAGGTRLWRNAGLSGRSCLSLT